MLYNTLKALCRLSGVSGAESPVAAFIQKEIAPYVDEVSTDALGNLIALKKGSAEHPTKVMFSAHMDEIGFIVNYIDEKGFIRFAPIGGINLRAALYGHVVFENGVKGILVPEADKAADAKFATCYVDIGAYNQKDAEKRVSIGDTFHLVGDITAISGRVWAGRPLDDRAGCAILLEVAKTLPANVENDIYFVFSSQEEVGCRGAKTAAFNIMPDFGFALDVTATGDVPGAHPMAVSQGKGAAIKVKDSSLFCNPALVAAMHKLAKEQKITHQTEVLTAGGTDASAIQLAGSGAYAGGISIPSRYIHSGVETVDRRDVEACVKLSRALATADLFKLCNISK